jgi:hypothetical protein
MSAKLAAERTHRKRSRAEEPWLATGLDLNQRIALGLPEAMKIIRLDCARLDHVEEFQAKATNFITNISLIEIDPSLHQQRQALLKGAAKFREGWQILKSRGPTWTDSWYYYTLPDLLIDIEHDAARFPDTRGGGSEVARKQKWQKQESFCCSWSLIVEFGRCGPPTVTEGKPLLQLSQLVFEIATGNMTGSLKKVALEVISQKERLRVRGTARQLVMAEVLPRDQIPCRGR